MARPKLFVAKSFNECTDKSEYLAGLEKARLVDQYNRENPPTEADIDAAIADCLKRGHPPRESILHCIVNAPCDIEDETINCTFSPIDWPFGGSNKKMSIEDQAENWSNLTSSKFAYSVVQRPQGVHLLGTPDRSGTNFLLERVIEVCQNIWRVSWAQGFPQNPDVRWVNLPATNWSRFNAEEAKFYDLLVLQGVYDDRKSWDTLRSWINKYSNSATILVLVDTENISALESQFRYYNVRSVSQLQSKTAFLTATSAPTETLLDADARIAQFFAKSDWATNSKHSWRKNFLQSVKDALEKFGSLKPGQQKSMLKTMADMGWKN